MPTTPSTKRLGVPPLKEATAGGAAQEVAKEADKLQGEEEAMKSCAPLLSPARAPRGARLWNAFVDFR